MLLCEPTFRFYFLPFYLFPLADQPSTLCSSVTHLDQTSEFSRWGITLQQTHVDKWLLGHQIFYAFHASADLLVRDTSDRTPLEPPQKEEEISQTCICLSEYCHFLWQASSSCHTGKRQTCQKEAGLAGMGPWEGCGLEWKKQVQNSSFARLPKPPAHKREMSSPSGPG